MRYRHQSSHQEFWFWVEPDDEDRIYFFSYIGLLAKKHCGTIDKIGRLVSGQSPNFAIFILFDPEAGEWALADIRRDIRRDEPISEALRVRLMVEDPGLALGTELYNRAQSGSLGEPRAAVPARVRKPYVEPDETPTGPPRLFKAIMWREGRHPPEERVSILATSLIQARRLLREQYPGDTIVYAYNEEDSNKKRG